MSLIKETRCNSKLDLLHLSKKLSKLPNKETRRASGGVIIFFIQILFFLAVF